MLSQSMGYAASALGILASSDGKPMLVRDIAEVGDIPTSYLGKLMHTLGRKGILQTQRGIGGGISLIPKPHDLTLYRLCELLDEPAIRERCMLGVTECSDDRACPCHSFWTAHRKALIEFLKKTTIADMASFETRRALGLKELNGKRSGKRSR